jgi:hypothetical protein
LAARLPQGVGQRGLGVQFVTLNLGQQVALALRHDLMLPVYAALNHQTIHPAPEERETPHEHGA